jgi:glycosyltransferase involved in cell wall biosynthesis
MPALTLITPTIGHRHLARCLRSAQSQAFPDFEHVLVIDGEEHLGKVEPVLAEMDLSRVPVRVLRLPYPTGKDRYICHRIYGSVPWLCNTKWVSFLDEDNWFDDDHLSTLMNSVTSASAAWGFSLRKIVDTEGKLVALDECESLGNLHCVFQVNGVYHVDTNCYLIDRQLAIKYCAIWNRRFREQVSPDIELCNTLLRNEPPPASNRRHTVNYTAGSTESSVGAQQFLVGNRIMHERYPNGLPWKAAGFVPPPAARPQPANPFATHTNLSSGNVRFVQGPK